MSDVSGSRRSLYALVAVALVAGALATFANGPTPRASHVPSSWVSAPGGLRALFLTARELGIEAERWERPLDEVDDAGREPTGLAIVGGRALHAEEVEHVSRWLTRGGRLLFVPRGPTDPLLATFGLELAATTCPDCAPTVSDRQSLADPLGGLLLEGGPENRFFLGKYRLRLAAATDATVVSLLSDGGDTMAAALVRLGAGEAIVLATPTAITNARLGASGVAPFALRALAHVAAGDVLWFDEFHHGYDARSGLWGMAWHLLVSTHAGWAVIALVAVALLALASAGIRLGAPALPPPAPRRSSLEHVRALAVAYETAAAHGRARALLLAELRVRLGLRSAEALRAWLDAAGRTPGARATAAAVIARHLDAVETATLPTLAAAIDALVVEEPDARRRAVA